MTSYIIRLEKEEKYLNTLGTNPRGDLDQKRELQKCNETLTPSPLLQRLACFAWVIGACEENKSVHKIHPLKLNKGSCKV